MEEGVKSVQIEAPEPGLTSREIVARAEAMRPELIARQAETEERTFYSEETHEEFTRAGFYRILAPRRFGGYEFDLTTYYKVMIAISRGCPSTGWQACLAGAHCLQLASYWGEQAQEELFGPDGHFLASMSQTFKKPPIATPVEGGYVVDGTWHYASGVPHATHHMGFLHLAGGKPGEPPQTMMAVIPREKFEMLDDWGGLIGLKGSGSHSVHVEEAFIPAHHVIPFGMFQDVENGTPGYRLHGNPIFAGQFMATALGTINSVQVGNAQAVLDEYEGLIRSRKTMSADGTGVPRFEDRDFQRCLGLGMSYIDAAESIVLRTGDLYLEYSRQGVEEGVPFSPEQTMRIYGQQMTAHKLCWEAGDLLFRTSSSSGAMDGTRMQRSWRDLCAMRANGLHQLDFRSPSIAQAHLGLQINFL